MPPHPQPKWAAIASRGIAMLGRAGGAASMLIGWTLTATVTYDVLLRTFGQPSLWAPEVSIYLMVAMAFVGVGATYGVNGHFRVSFVRNLCPPKVRVAFDIFSLCVSLLFTAGFIYGAWKLTSFSTMLNLKTSTLLEVPMWILYGLLLLGGILLLIAILQDAIYLIKTGHSARDDAQNPGEVV